MAILMTAFAALGARGDVTLTLKPVARIHAGSALMLTDVCAGAERLADVVIRPEVAAGSRVRVTVEDVRIALRSRGLVGADVALRGDACVVLVRAQAADTAPTQAAEVARSPEPTAPTGTTIRGHIRVKLEQVLGGSGDRLDLRFEADDAAVLDRSAAGLTVDVHPLGLGRRTPVRVTLYAADGTIEVHRVLVGVRLLREVARASRVLPRGSGVSAEDFAISAEWLGPDEPYAEPAAVVGQRLRRGVDAGEMLTDANIEPPIAIERGDLVMVHVVSGSVVLRREARALETGRAGQRIRLEPMAGGRAFRAEIEGPGRAVIVARPPIGGDDR